MWIFVGLCFLLLKLQDTHGVVITVQPSSGVAVMDVDRLEITCTAANSAVLSVVNSFQISKGSMDVVSVTYDRVTGLSKIDWQSSSYQGRATAEGNVHDPNPANKYLKLTFEANKTLCTDEGYYTCRLQGQFQDGTQHQESANGTVVINSNPGNMDAINVPITGGVIPGQNNGRFPIGMSVQLTCTGLVGKPPMEIRWCYKLFQDQGFATLNSFSAIWNQSDPVATGMCNNRRTSVLSYGITTIDVSTILLCEPASSSYFCGQTPWNSTFTVEALGIPNPLNAAPGRMAKTSHIQYGLLLCIVNLLYGNYF